MVDKALDGAITQLIAAGEIKGKSGELTLVHSQGKISAKRVIVAGLGKQAQFNVDSVRRVSAASGRGIDELRSDLERHRKWLADRAVLVPNRRPAPPVRTRQLVKGCQVLE